MNHVISCVCHEVIVKSTDSEVKIRGKVIVLKDDQAFSICKSCGTEVAIPLRLDTELLKSLSNPRLYIKK